MSGFKVCLLVMAAVAAVQCASTDFPGRTISPDRQCELKNFPSGVCAQADMSQRCEHLMCGEGRGDIPSAVDAGPALDGTTCGDKMICIEGACVSDPNPPKNPVVIREYGCQEWDY